ncbi:4'-phosphopantetheinyl transferase family protein [Streptomyces sp. NPDC058280]|uniref:4'-phosphopantetheinyl transferase family protein n=1 Tax=Streptomyces sp. NPDC058280 TaxID=3346419 RepID=UPI0036E93E17
MAPPYNLSRNARGRGAEHSPAAAFRALRSCGETNIWWWRPPLRTDPADLPLLNTEEFRQALCLRSELDAAAYVHARAAARRAVGKLLGVGPEEIDLDQRTCPACGDPGHGPPRLGRPDLPLAISLARTAGHGVFAAGTGSAIGVDAEVLRPVRRDVLSESWLTADEGLHLLTLPRGPARDAVFYRCWTRKEAVVKARGRGLKGIQLDRIESYPATSGTVRMHCPDQPGPAPGRGADGRDTAERHGPEETDTDASRTDTWIVRDLELSDRMAAAVAQPEDTAAAYGPVRLHLPAGSTARRNSPGAR